MLFLGKRLPSVAPAIPWRGNPATKSLVATPRAPAPDHPNKPAMKIPPRCFGQSRPLFLAGLILAATGPGSMPARSADTGAPPAHAVADALQAIVPSEVGGVLGERLDLWRRVRLWRVARDPFLLDGFVRPPGTHPWQGEHAGKWLHAASLAHDATNDPELAAALRRVAATLVDSQQANGYLGTYAPGRRFFTQKEKGDPGTWDIWTHRYVIHGLLSYSQRHPDPQAVEACRRAAGLLAQTVGPPEGDITRFGTRSGLSSAVLLESIVLLYQRTGDPRHLDFARHIVRSMESNPRLRLMAAMRAGEDVTASGGGKAYQLMAVLLGYLELHRATGEKAFLEATVTAWEKIRAGHINIAGGPWSYQYEPTLNHECFAPPEWFHPTVCVETCSTTTWIQLSLSLFDLTGEARYADEAERALFNQLLGAQSPNGNDWAYHSMLNMPVRGYQDTVTCCASSGPRALELFARHLVCASAGGLVVNTYYVPATIPFTASSGQAGRVRLQGNYPLAPACTLRIEAPAPVDLPIDFRLPAGATGMELSINGVAAQPERTAQGFFRLRRVWTAEDEVSVRFTFALRAHFQTASDGVRWVGFTWGPLALAQSVVAQTDQPEFVLPVDSESEDGQRWLTPVTPRTPRTRSSDNAAEAGISNAAARSGPALTGVPSWQLRSPRRIFLAPYFLAGANGGGVRAMFPTRRSAP